MRETFLPAALVYYFLGRKVRDELVDIIVAAFRHIEFACGEVEKCDACILLAEIYRCEECVFLVDQNVFVHHYTRCHEFDDAAFYDAFYEFRVFELFAYCHTFACPDEFGQICVECVVWEPGQFDIACRAVGPAGESDAEYSAGAYGVLAEGFIEVSYPEQQYCVAVYGLDGVVLLHQWRFHVFFFFLHLLFAGHVVAVFGNTQS